MSGEDRRHESSGELRQRAEAAFLETAARLPESLAALSPEEARQTLHELRVHQIELEMQNEELRRAQAQLDQARSRYFDLYDMAPVGYCSVGAQDLILEANLTAATLLGAARSALAGQPISRFIRKEDQDIYYLQSKRLLETALPQAFDLRMLKHDGAQFWARLSATVAKDEHGATVLRVVLSDVSERKRTEEALQQQTRALRQRNDELEQFNRAAVDRELVMIGLKRQVNALSLQLGQAAPFDLAFADVPQDPINAASDSGSSATGTPR